MTLQDRPAESKAEIALCAVEPVVLKGTEPDIEQKIKMKGFNNMGSSWYLYKEGRQQGPFSREELDQMAQSGAFGPADLVWTEGMVNWARADRVEGLFAAAAPPPAPSPAPSPSPASTYHPQGPDGYQTAPARKKGKGGMIALIIVLAVVVLGGGFLAFNILFLNNTDDITIGFGSFTGGLPGGSERVTVSTRATIGEAGGKVEDPSGAAVLIPPGALEGPTEIKIGRYNSVPSPEDVELAGEVYFFGPEDVSFAKPVEVVVPYSTAQYPEGEEEGVELIQSLLVYRNGSWERVPEYSLDRENKAFIGKVEGFSGYSAGNIAGSGLLSYRLLTGGSVDFEGKGSLIGTAIVMEGHHVEYLPEDLPAVNYDYYNLIKDYLDLGTGWQRFRLKEEQSGHVAKAAAFTYVSPKNFLAIGIELEAESSKESGALTFAGAYTGIPMFLGLGFFPIPAPYIIEVQYPEDYGSALKDICIYFTKESHSEEAGAADINIVYRVHFSEEQSLTRWDFDDLIMLDEGRSVLVHGGDVRAGERIQIELFVFGIANVSAMEVQETSIGNPWKDHSGKTRVISSINVFDDHAGLPEPERRNWREPDIEKIPLIPIVDPDN